ncbi:putative amino acid permease, partial [Leptomonas seymouri]
MSRSGARHPIDEELHSGNRLSEDPMALPEELDTVDGGDPMTDAKNMGDSSSIDSSDLYDFDRYDPKHEIARQDQVRAERVARRRIPANIFQKYFGYMVPYGGLLSTGLNLASSSIGAGIIAMPLAFNASGLVMALIYMVVIAFLTIYSYYLLGQVAEKTGLRNYEQIVRRLMGTGADYFLAFCMWVFSFGAEVSYVIS